MVVSKKLMAFIWSVIGTCAGAIGTLAYYQHEVGDLQGRLKAATDDYAQQQKRADALAEQLRLPVQDPLVSKYKADALTCGAQLDSQKRSYDECEAQLIIHEEDQLTLKEIQALQAMKETIERKINEITTNTANHMMSSDGGPENLDDLRKEDGQLQEQILLLEGKLHSIGASPEQSRMASS